MKLLAGAIASLILLPLSMAISATSASAEGLDPAHVPADAKWVIHVDYEAISDSEMVQEIRQKSPTLTKAVQGWMTQRYGIDPPQDFHSATLFSRDYRRYTGTLLIQADYQPEKIEAVLRKQQNYRKSEQGAHTFHTVTLSHQQQQGPTGDQEMTVVMVDEDTLILASSPETAQQTLQLLSGDAPSLAGAQSPLLSENATEAWIYGAAIDLGQLKDHPVSMPVLAQHERIQWSFGSQDDGKLYEAAEAVARDPEVAEKIQKVLEGWVAYESLWAEGSDAMSKLIENVEITRDGNATKFYWEGEPETLTAALDDVLARWKTWAPMLKSSQVQ